MPIFNNSMDANFFLNKTIQDRALLNLMAHTWPHVSAAINIKVKDYFPRENRWFLQFEEKGGK